MVRYLLLQQSIINLRYHRRVDNIEFLDLLINYRNLHRNCIHEISQLMSLIEVHI